MMGLILQRAFFAREARVVAPALLGKLLCVRGADGVVRRGRLMEVEAYLPEGDLAAHGARGFTTAKASLFGEAGHLYVHPMRQYCGVDIVCGQVGEPTSVLLRAVVVDGLRVDGPGKLTRALGIVRAMDGWDVCGGGCVWVEDDGVVVEVPLAGPRVGISKSTELALRWVWRG